MTMKRNWMLFILLTVLVACTSTEPKTVNNCTPLSKTDFSKQPKDIMAELDTCMDSKMFKQAAEKFLALASNGEDDSFAKNQPAELNQLRSVIGKRHPEAAIKALEIEIKRIHQNNADLCKRIGLFNASNLNEQAIKNDDDRALIKQLNKSFSDNKKWKRSLAEFLRCQ